MLKNFFKAFLISTFFSVNTLSYKGSFLLSTGHKAGQRPIFILSACTLCRIMTFNLHVKYPFGSDTRERVLSPKIKNVNM